MRMLHVGRRRRRLAGDMIFDWILIQHVETGSRIEVLSSPDVDVGRIYRMNHLQRGAPVIMIARSMCVDFWIKLIDSGRFEVVDGKVQRA